MKEDKKLLLRIKRLEERVEALERKPKHGDKLRVIAEWIEEQFEDEESVPVKRIMKEGKKKGFSTQMISRARRELLADKIVPVVASGRGWTWEVYDGE